MKQPPIQSASLSWNDQGTPVSQHFGDIYFSNEDGLEETRHVFLHCSHFPARFSDHPRPLCIVAETGFGTGLNFLTLWQAFDRFRQQEPEATLKRLHFISFEKFPLQADDLGAALAHWPELAEYADALRRQWPLPFAGCHRLVLANGAVTLDLWFGDVNTLLPECDVSLENQVDAWFLDGFAPSKNPDMWSETLFAAMARLARPGGTFATFTAAGFVRRGLQQAGFAAAKVRGFGQKREMLAGVLDVPPTLTDPAPWYVRPAAQQPLDIAIIGGGIASVLTASALLRRGAKVTLYCADTDAAEGASGNRQGAVYPLLNGKHDALEDFFASAFTFAQRQYQQLADAGLEFDHQWCGVSQLGYDEKSDRKIARIRSGDWPEGLVSTKTAAEMDQETGLPCGFGGLGYPLGGWLSPQQLTRALLRKLQDQGLIYHADYSLQQLSARDDGSWTLDFSNGQQTLHPTVILANGHQLGAFIQSEKLPVYPVRGQVSHIPANGEIRQLKQVLCYDGYLTPMNPATQQHCIGASYQRGETETDYRDSEQQQNRQRLIDCLPNQEWPTHIDVSAGQARSGVRCATRDHLPMLGSIPDYAATLAQYEDLPRQIKRGLPIQSAPVLRNLFVIGALGSRGLSSAPLAAEILAAQIFAEPQPCSTAILHALNPNRLWIRKLLKSRPV